MNRSLIKIEFAKMRLYFIVMFITACYVFMNPYPLRSIDIIACTLGLLHGATVGFLVFKDFGGTEAFIFSRPFTRNSLFWHRWSLGIALQFMTMAIVAVIIATGLRSLILFDSPYQPMIKFCELNVLCSFAFSMFAGFAVSVFFTLRNRILNTEKPRTIAKQIIRSMPHATIPLVFGIIAVSGLHSMGSTPNHLLLYAWVYIIAINAVSLFAGRQCFLEMEINS